MGCQSPGGTPYTMARMTSCRRRDPERGNSLLLALIVMSSLATLGTLTVVSVQSSLKASTNDRAGSIAMYAAESGIALAIEYLRTNWAAIGSWTPFVVANNAPPLVTLPFPSNGALPGSSDNPFTADQNAWFVVETKNNRTDPQLANPGDSDDQIVLRSTGRGPQGSVAIVELEIRRYPFGGPLPSGPTQPVIFVGWRVAL